MVDVTPPSVTTTTTATTATTTSARSWPALLAFVLVGFALRMWGLTFGLPFPYHVDEALYNNVGRIVAEEGVTRLHPSFSAFQAVIIGEHELLTLLWPILRHLPLSSEVTITLVSRAESYNLLGRLTSATFGALTAIPVFLLGRKLWGRSVGLVAALLMTLCYIHVRESHYGVPEAMVCFLTITAAYFGTRLYDRCDAAGYVIAGAMAGLAIGTKQLVWPVVVLLFTFHMAAPGKGTPWRGTRSWISRALSAKLLLAFAVVVMVYLVCVPQTVLRWNEFYTFWKATHDLGHQGGMDRIRLEDTGPIGTYLGTLRWGLGDALAALSAAGVLVSLVRPLSPRERILMLFPILYFGFLLAPGSMFFARYVMSALPFLVLAAAALLWRGFIGLRLAGGPRAAAALAVIAVVLAQPVTAIVRHDVLLSRTDTRTLAKAWIEQNVPANSTVMLEFQWFSPFLSSENDVVPLSTRSYNVLTRGAYGLSDFSDTFGPSKGTPPIDAYRSAGVDYIVANSYSWGSRLIDPEEDQAKREFYRTLDREAELVQEFSPYVKNQTVPRIFDETYGPAIGLWRIERPGPVLKIYRLTKSADDAK